MASQQGDADIGGQVQMASVRDKRPADSGAGYADADSKEVAVDVANLPASHEQVQRVLNLEMGFEALVKTISQNVPLLPNVHVEWENLSYSVAVPDESQHVENMWTAVSGMFTGLFRGKKQRLFHVLNNVSGHLRPGTVTLLLAPPGHGKSALLKALSNRIPQDKLAGHIWYGGRSPDEVNVNRLAAYVDQTDIHLPLLSVKETFDFAFHAWAGKERPGFNDLMRAADQQKVHNLLQILGLEHCKDTMVGNDMIRGVSGGEKKRVTFGEMVAGNARVLMLDEISTGLDSAATLDITRTICTFTKTFNTTLMISLLQPNPEVFALFDDVMLMREGQIIYHGPQDRVVQYFEEMGLHFPPDQDVADFITEFISDPRQVYERQVRRLARSGVAGSIVPPLTTDDLVLYFKASFHKQDWGILNRTAAAADAAAAAAAADDDGGEEFKSSTLSRALSNAHTSIATDELELNIEGPYAKHMYESDYAHRSLWEQMSQLLERQWKVQRRNVGFIGPRIGQAIFMGLVLGVVFFQLGVDDYQLTFGLLFFSAIFLSFANLSEVPIASEAKLVVYKQTEARFYSTAAYIGGVLLTHLPVATIECAIFGSITYFMCGFASEAARYFTFLLLIWLLSLLMSNVFRLFAFLAPNEDTAQSMVGPCVGVFLLFGGFLITKDNIPEWLVWIYWSTPFSWAIRALVINEFKSADYDAVIGGIRLGDRYLTAFNVSTNEDWVWGAVAYLAVAYILLSMLSAFIVEKIHYDARIGTTRSSVMDLDSPALRAHREHRAARALRLRSASMASTGGATITLPFEPMTVAFKDLRYSVPIQVDGQTVQKQLLCGINGFARPGTLCALMGASGAGKSTLMDVVCGRKTGGTMSGEILVNGHPKEARSFARVMGYVEQFDLLMPYATVRETLQFSAQLRLDAAVPAAQREAYVESVIQLLELQEIADRLVGDESSSSAISPGERKRLTIGVELVANPTVLFLDEPTSGLDSRSAMSVMRAVKRVADTGRTVICTIHQPSSEIFFMFDQLLLLQKGGKVVYFGSVEDRAKPLVKYLEAIPGTKPLPPHTNPADWMLTVIGSGVALTQGEVDKDKYSKIYDASELCTQNEALLRDACATRPGSQPLHFNRTYVRSVCEQLGAVCKRQVLSAWRNTALNFSRLVIMIVLSLAFGLLFYQLDSTSDRAGVNSLNGFIAIAPLFVGIIFMTTAVPVLSRERAVFYRERASNTYASFAYAAAVFVAEVPFCAAGVFIFQVITYNMVGLKDDTSVFFHYFLVAYLLAQTMLCCGQFLVSVLPNKQVAQILSGVLLSLFNLFGGFFIPEPSLAKGTLFLYYANPVSYAFQAMTSLQFHCEGASCPSVEVFSSAGVAQVPISTLMSSYLGFDYDARWTMTIVVACWMVGFHILTHLSLAFVNHLQR